ncbi:hypothetical protein SO802_021494 [Lithocarpus litseifolius]|uniref:Reverse transcriptase zinc-binding domain-containing protein n=1 Tax=Lithocarpus litseifolius TaxID=425828 RepID=A0AAW2CGG7_9ROSI
MVVEKGMMWRIGDGNRIRVFYDNWILGVFPLKAIARTQELIDDCVISSLIDTDTGEWNEQMIDHLISPFLAQRIKAIPLCKTRQEDCILWPRSRDENYIVKTGYQLLGEIENRDVASSSSQATQRQFWNSMWKLDVPNKIKKFCWRACTKSLPIAKNLYRKRVLDSPLCSSCVFSNSDEAGLGVVVRNKKGEVMVSLAEKLILPYGGVEVIEAMAARRAIHLAVELGFRKCIFEGIQKLCLKH